MGVAKEAQKQKEKRKAPAEKKTRGAAPCVAETVVAEESEVVLPVDGEATEKRKVDFVCDTETQSLRLQESGIKGERQNDAPKMYR